MNTLKRKKGRLLVGLFGLSNLFDNIVGPQVLCNGNIYKIYKVWIPFFFLSLIQWGKGLQGGSLPYEFQLGSPLLIFPHWIKKKKIQLGSWIWPTSVIWACCKKHATMIEMSIIYEDMLLSAIRQSEHPHILTNARMFIFWKRKEKIKMGGCVALLHAVRGDKGVELLVTFEKLLRFFHIKSILPWVFKYAILVR